MKNKITYLLFFGLVLIGFSFNVQMTAPSKTASLLTTKTTFIAGELITLKFSNNSKTNPQLYISNSYGSILLTPKSENGFLIFSIPESISVKTGTVNWKLLDAKPYHSGSFFIRPQGSAKSLESYLGPPSIQAGDTDFSMMVIIPTDDLDNPLTDGTAVNIKTQFLDEEESSEIFTKNFVAYKNIYSPKQTGRILIGSESLGKTSKEFDINVLAAIPTNFTITKKRHHKYADGNQIATLSTSQIKDQYNNTVEDGTFVEFYIKNNNGSILKTSGTTIDGLATAKIIHPDHAEKWTVKAIINGMAESNEITFSFEQLFDDYEVTFSDDNRIISVGPLKSFMQQLVPDGFNVNFLIYKDQELIKTIYRQTIMGEVTFKLNNDIFPSGRYTFKTNTAGLEKTYYSKQLR